MYHPPSPCHVGLKAAVVGLLSTGKGAEGKVAGPEGQAGSPGPGRREGLLSLPEPAWWLLGPWVLPLLVEVGVQPDVARLLQGPRRQGWGWVLGLTCKIPTPSP